MNLKTIMMITIPIIIIAIIYVMKVRNDTYYKINPTHNIIFIIMDKRIIAIKERLEGGINVISIDIVDQGYMHKGHTAHTEGKMHIWVEIVSDDFIDMNPIQRHQLIYTILSEELEGDLHAISLNLMTSSELDNSQNHTGEKND